MKLQKQLSRRIGNIEYTKWVIAIPPKDISLMNWKAGIELEAEKTDNGLLIRPKKIKIIKKPN